MKELLPPYDLDAEVAVLGSCLIDSGASRQIDIGAEDFFSEQNQYVFQAVRETGEGCNQITVANKLVNMGKLDEAGGVAYLSHLVAMVPTSLHVVYYAAIVKDLSFHRRAISLAGQIENYGYQPGDMKATYTKIQEAVNKLGKSVRTSQILTPAEICAMATERYESMRQIKPGVLYGIKALDDRLLGLLENEVVVLAARGGEGKTTLMTQMARYQSHDQTIYDMSGNPIFVPARNVYIFTSEMDRKQLTDKNVAKLAGISEKAIKQGNYSPETWEAIQTGIWKLAEHKLYIIDGGITSTSIRQTVERALDTTGCDVVYVDYLQNLTDKTRESNNVRVETAMRNLQLMAKECNVRLTVLCQLNEDWKRRYNPKNPKSAWPIDSDLRDSGAIKDITDTLIFLHRPWRIDENQPKEDALVRISKDRLRGNLVDFYIKYERGFYL